MPKQKKEDWKEYPDPTPIEIPMELKRPETTDERLRRILSEERMKRQMNEAGLETIDEASDFDVGDDFEVDEPITQYEVHGMVDEFPVSEERPEYGSEGGTPHPPEDPEKTEGQGKGEQEIVEPEANEEVE